MEVDEIQCKFPRIRKANGVRTSQTMDDQYPDEEEGEKNKRAAVGNGGALDLCGGLGRFYGYPSSRIVRVSRASGGKDRHSKVLTSKGLRDRRVRLSVNTAIQFYDLQDRLGFDQPSKAVEWLLKAAESSIAELPPMDSLFPDEKMSSTGGSDQLGLGSAELDMDGMDGGQQQAAVAAKSSACSSTSETSKGSGLSLSRSENRIKARDRAKERVAEKEKEKESESSLNPISQTFTELLNGGINNVDNNTTPSPNNDSGTPNESNFFLKSPRQWSSAPMDYFSTGLVGPPASTRATTQMHLVPNSFTSALFNVSVDHQQEQLQHFFVPDHLVSVAGGNSNCNNNNDDSRSNEYNLNFTIASSANSAGLAGFNRGTLQSNSSSSYLLPHFQRLHDGSPPSFFIGTAASLDNNHHHHQQQFLAGYDPRLQLYYGDAHANASNGGRHSNQKGKGRN